MIDAGVFIGLGAGIAVCVALPVGGFLWCRRRYGAVARPFFIGVLCFLVSQVLTRIPIVSVLLPRQAWFVLLSSSNYLLYGLFMAFTAGLFEELGRYLCVRFLLKRNRGWGDAVSFGFGHGGFEAVVITGLSLVTYLIYCLMINNGSFTAFVSVLPAEQSEALLALIGGMTIGDGLMGGAERVIAVALHVGMTVIVLRGFAVGKPGRYTLYAILVHTIVDFFAVILPVWGVTGWTMEAVFALMAAAVLLWALRMRTRTDWEPKEELKNEEDISISGLSD